MTRRAAQVYELLTDWIPCTTPPVRDGVYEFHHTDKFYPESVFGANVIHVVRAIFKDGKWHTKTHKSQELTGINNFPGSYSWRGVRRWVLVNPQQPVPGKTMYLKAARPRGVQYSGLGLARPFRTEAAAQRFADRYSRLGLTAVLP